MGFSLDLSNSDSKYWHIPYANHGAGILTYMTGWFWTRTNVGVHIPAPWFAYGHGLNQAGWWWLEPWNFYDFPIRCPIILGISSPQLTSSPSFFRGVGRNHQPDFNGHGFKSYVKLPVGIHVKKYKQPFALNFSTEWLDHLRPIFEMIRPRWIYGRPMFYSSGKRWQYLTIPLDIACFSSGYPRMCLQFIPLVPPFLKHAMCAWIKSWNWAILFCWRDPSLHWLIEHFGVINDWMDCIHFDFAIFCLWFSDFMDLPWDLLWDLRHLTTSKWDFQLGIFSSQLEDDHGTAKHPNPDRSNVKIWYSLPASSIYKCKYTRYIEWYNILDNIVYNSIIIYGSNNHI